MSEATGGVAAPVNAEGLYEERQEFWGGFYHFVWGIAAAAVVLLILMAIFLT